MEVDGELHAANQAAVGLQKQVEQGKAAAASEAESLRAQLAASGDETEAWKR